MLYSLFVVSYHIFICLISVANKYAFYMIPSMVFYLISL